MISIEQVFEVTDELITQLTPLGEEFFLEAKLPGVFNPKHMFSVLRTMMDMKAGAFWVSHGDNNEVTGAIAGTLYPDFLTGDMIAIENFWFVSKPYRITSVGIRLYNRYEIWAEDSGADRIHVGLIAGLNEDTIEKWYDKRGFTKLEIIYKRSV